MRDLAQVLLAVLTIVTPCATTFGQVKMTTKQALALAFPRCKIERQTKLLSAAQRRQISKLTGQEFTRAAAFAYVARRAGKIVGTGWFDAHRVRSKKQLLMVAVTPEQTVSRVEILAFLEPRRYRAPRPWLRRLEGKGSDSMQLGKGVQRITGATLTVQATTRCVARVLAMHRVIFGPVAKPPETASNGSDKPAAKTGSKAVPKPVPKPVPKTGSTGAGTGSKPRSKAKGRPRSMPTAPGAAARVR